MQYNEYFPRNAIRLKLYTNANIAVRARNAALRVYIDTPWSTQLVKVITTLLVELSACFSAQLPPTSDSKPCRVVDPNHSLCLSTSHLTTLRLHMILTKTSTNTDKSSSSQDRLISLSPNFIFRRTPFYFVMTRAGMSVWYMVLILSKYFWS